MRKGVLVAFGAVALVGAAAFVVIARSPVVDGGEIAGIAPDLARGETVFWAMGCASCHAADGAQGEARLVLSGGHRLVTPFGTFVAPNISQDDVQGIGGWSTAEVVSAVRYGSAPGGGHYYPAFPYAAYGNATLDDLVSLAAYLETLPADATPNAPHELSFPYSVRAGIGLWKRAFTGSGWVMPATEPGEPRGAQPREILARVVARPRERRGRNHQEPLAPGRLLVGREFLGRHEAVHR
jgi:hypothetical protein